MFKLNWGRVAVLLASFVFVSGVSAKEAQPDAMSVQVLEKHYIACADGFDGYMRSIQECIGGVFKKQDVYLNQLWLDLKGKLQTREEKPEVYGALLEEQRKWLAYRDVSCHFYYDMDGTIWRTIAADCRFDIVQGRLKVLESFYTSLTDMEI